MIGLLLSLFVAVKINCPKPVERLLCPIDVRAYLDSHVSFQNYTPVEFDHKLNSEEDLSMVEFATNRCSP